MKAVVMAMSIMIESVGMTCSLIFVRRLFETPMSSLDPGQTAGGRLDIHEILNWFYCYYVLALFSFLA